MLVSRICEILQLLTLAFTAVMRDVLKTAYGNITICGDSCFDLQGEIISEITPVYKNGKQYLAVDGNKLYVLFHENGNHYRAEVNLNDEKIIPLSHGKKGIPIDKLYVKEQFVQVEWNPKWSDVHQHQLLEVMVSKRPRGGGAYNSVVAAQTYLNGRRRKGALGEIYKLLSKAILLRNDEQLADFLPLNAQYQAICNCKAPATSLVINIDGQSLTFREPAPTYCANCDGKLQVEEAKIAQINSVKDRNYFDFLCKVLPGKSERLSLAITDSAIKLLGAEALLPFARLCHNCILNEDELRHFLADLNKPLSNAEDPEAAVIQNVRTFRQEVGTEVRIYITRADKGALVLDHDGTVYLQAVAECNLLVQQTCKGGDTFNGVMLVLETLGYEANEILKIANAAAQLYVFRSELPTPEGIQEFQQEFGIPEVISR
jgi:hypothetical protein